MIFDEVHHLPAPSWGETALMSPSPFRLGLTATYPEHEEMGDGRWHIEDLIGPIVYQKRVSDLVGQRLAEYRTERIRIDLTAEERAQYDADFAIYCRIFPFPPPARDTRRRLADGTHAPERVRARGAGALLARQRMIDLLAGAEGKL